MKGACREGSKGARGGKGKHKCKGEGKSNLKGDAAPANADEERLDMKALPAAALRQWSRPRWCSDFLKGCCTKDPCPYPHHSETVVADMKEKDAVFKTAAAASTDSRGRGKKWEGELTR